MLVFLSPILIYNFNFTDNYQLKYLYKLWYYSIYRQSTFFHYQEGSLVDDQAYKPYTLVGPPALWLELDP